MSTLTDSDGERCNFTNYYRCPTCEHEWEDQWSCACDDDCPACGEPAISLYDYEIEGED